MTSETQDEGRLARAIGHPIRLRTLALLGQRVMSPKCIAKELGEPLENVSYHVKVLRDLDCIELVRTEPRRGATEHFYRSTTRAWLTDADSEDLSHESRAGISSTILNAAFCAVSASIAEGRFDERTDRHLSITRLELTEAGWRQLNARLDAVLEEAMALHAEALHADGPKVRSDLAVAHFPSASGGLGAP
jgi:DNA-binding transcriptional ArsR family regulator